MQQQQALACNYILYNYITTATLIIIIIIYIVPAESEASTTTQYDLSLILPATYSRFVAAANAVNITPYSLPPIFTLFAPINSAFEV
jgi:hypothetical protein